MISEYELNDRNFIQWYYFNEKLDQNSYLFNTLTLISEQLRSSTLKENDELRRKQLWVYIEYLGSPCKGKKKP